MVLVDKLPWAAHKGNPIYSIHVQQNGTRFATGGSDSKVKVWNLLAAIDARQEAKSNVSKLLATLTDHNGPVNVVRFSHDGRLLASGSDDRMACIYELRPGAGGGVLGSDTPNVENWRTKCVLRGHVNNVVDLVWSPDDTKLVTVSLETRAMVWDITSGLCIKALDGHTSFLKGVAWDPVGTYIATHSEDKKVLIWRTDDWSVVGTIESPFIQMVTSTFACRLSWSPDGRYLLAGNSYQGTMHSAVVIPREAWDKKDQYMLINGHERAVVAPLFSPRMFHLPKSNGSEGYVNNLTSVFALGSQDRVVTIWNAATHRAMFATRLFKAQVTDMSWAADGRSLLACSGDGTVAIIQFAMEEMGKAATEEEMQLVMKTLYGTTGGRSAKRVLAESAEQLHFEESLETGAVAPPGGGTALNGPSTAKQGGPLVSVTGQNLHRPPDMHKPTVPAPDAAMARLNARLGGGNQDNGTTQVGFAGAAAAGPSTSRALVPIPPPRPVSRISPIRREAPIDLAVAGKGPAAKRLKMEARAAPSNDGGAIQMYCLPVPRVQQELNVVLGKTTPLLAGLDHDRQQHQQQILHELCVSNRERGGGGNPQCAFEYKMGGSLVWKDVLPGRAVAATGTLKFSAIAMEDGNLLVYTAAGRRICPPLKLGSGIAVLSSDATWQLLAITSTGSLKLFDVETLKCTMECSLLSLMEDGHAVLDVQLSTSGIPMITLTNSNAYVWHKGLGTWMCVADESLAASYYAPLAGLSGQGELGGLQAQALGAAAAHTLGPPRLAVSVGTTVQRHISRAHLECNMAAAQELGCGNEYRRAVVAYARLLAEEGDAGRLTELCDGLMGGPAAGEGWQPTVLGIDKRGLLRKDVLREVARNRDLGGLLQRMTTALDDLEISGSR